MNKSEYYALTEASEMLNCSRDRLISFGASGELPLYVLGSRYRVEAVEIDRFNKTERKFVVAGRESKIFKLSRYCLLELESGDIQAEVVIEPEPIYKYTNTNPKSPIFKEYEPGQWRRQIGEIRYFLEYKNTVNPLDIFSTKDLLDMEKRGFNTDTLFSPVRLNECVMVVLAKDLERFEQARQSSSKLTDSEKDKLLKQIGLLALVLSEKSNKFKRGEKPNASQIANNAQEIIEAGDFSGKSGTGSTELRNSISEGLRLLSE